MSDREAFERAFVAVSHLLGRREDVVRSLGGSVGNAAREVSRKLVEGDRTSRAQALADELLPLVAALDARGLE